VYNVRKDYENDCDTELSQWEEQLALLKNKVDNGNEEEKRVFSNAIMSLELKQDEVKAKVLELRASGDEAWEELKTAMEATRMNLRAFFCSIAAKMLRKNEEL